MRKPETYMAELELERRRVENWQDELSRLIQHGGPGEIRAESSYLDADCIHGSGNRMDAITISQEIVRITNEINEIQGKIDRIAEHLKRSRELVPLLNDNKKKVWYLRDYCGLNLVEIADEIHLSYQRVKEISAQLNKEH